MKAYRVITAVGAAVLLLAGQAMAGGGYVINWDNDASTWGNNTGYIYTTAAGSTLLPAGNEVQLVGVVSGSTTIPIWTSQIGNDPGDIISEGDPTAGAFNITSSSVLSNVLEPAKGLVMGVLVYGQGGGEILITATGGEAETVPSPDWSQIPTAPQAFELDASQASVLVISGTGGFVPEGSYDNEEGFFVGPSIPEPSTITLVGLGVLGAIGLVRRRR